MFAVPFSLCKTQCPMDIFQFIFLTLSFIIKKTKTFNLGAFFIAESEEEVIFSLVCILFIVLSSYCLSIINVKGLVNKNS